MYISENSLICYEMLSHLIKINVNKMVILIQTQIKIHVPYLI